MTAPLLTTRDALVAALTELLGHDGNTKYYDVPGSSRHAAVRYADALLASGVVRDPATLADDEALVGYVHNFVPLGFREGRDPYSNTYEAAQGILRDPGQQELGQLHDGSSVSAAARARRA